MDRIRSIFGGIAGYWENLTDRERMLLGVLGGVAALLFVLLPVYLLSASISELEAENAQIASALSNISHSRGQLAAQRAARAAAEARYASRAPSLGSFLEAKTGELEGMTISDVQHEPERELGRFRIRHSRARFQGTGLRNAILLMQGVKNSRYPVAIERVHIDHHNAGDRYNLQLGILAYDREGGDTPDAGTPAAPSGGSDTPGRAGPPAP